MKEGDLLFKKDEGKCHKIDIKNFGPISNVEMMNITDILFLIGEQASGKSTVAKLIYFFRTLHEEFVNVIFTSGYEDWDSCGKAFNSLLKSKFTNIFGYTSDLGNFKIAYYYSSIVKVELTPAGVYLNINFQPYYELENIWVVARNILQLKRENALGMYASMVKDTEARREVIRRVKALFAEEFSPIYVPAGRALLSRPMLAKLVQKNDHNELIGEGNKTGKYSPFDFVDVPTRNYIDEVDLRVRPWLITEDHENSNKKLDNDLRLLDDISAEIIKGKYLLINDREYIQLPDQSKVQLSYASSGQQEIVWLLNILRYYAFSEQKCFIVIEEPETHLHPDAQYLLVKYIAAYKNMTKSQILITTHSPYILSSFNNLFYADNCSKKCSEKIGDIAKLTAIPSQCWLEASDFTAYILEGTTATSARSIKNENLGMTDIAELDAVASRQDDEYEQLLRMIKGGH